jgi:MFS family permease
VSKNEIAVFCRCVAGKALFVKRLIARFAVREVGPRLLICIQLLDGVSGSILGVLTALIVADLTQGTGRFNLAQGFVGTLGGTGASLSTTFFGLVFGNFGNAIGFFSIAGVAISTVFLAWLLMPETKPSSEKVNR